MTATEAITAIDRAGHRAYLTSSQEALVAGVEAVLAIHYPHTSPRPWCTCCGDEWPCPTARALGVEE